MGVEGPGIGTIECNRGPAPHESREDMARNFRELEAKMSPASLERSRVLAEKYRAEMPFAFASRGAGDDAGASGENSGSESGSGVEVGTACGYVRKHAAELCESDRWRVENYGAVPGGDCGD
jgi:hypothetical protein